MHLKRKKNNKFYVGLQCLISNLFISYEVSSKVIQNQNNSNRQ